MWSERRGREGVCGDNTSQGKGKINILALAAHREQQALMQPGDAPVTPGHGDLKKKKILSARHGRLCSKTYSVTFSNNYHASPYISYTRDN